MLPETDSASFEESSTRGAISPIRLPTSSLSLGRYLLFDEFASGGMASVHFGRLSGAAGFSRVVAIKRLHVRFAKDPEFVSMLLDEARLVARIRHPNVVPTLDVVATDGEIFVVMEYVHGESLAKLWRAMRAEGRHLAPRLVATILSGVLHGLHAAHEARGERGAALDIVHRDVSPHNILVSVEGAARVLDFGVAKAAGRVQTTERGQIKGKLGYMPPEQLDGLPLTRTADVYAAGVVLWELLTGQRAFRRENEAAVVAAIRAGALPLPSAVAPHASAAFDAIVLRAMHPDPRLRYASAREMALELEQCAGVASMSEIGDWVQSYARHDLARRARRMASIERAPAGPEVSSITDRTPPPSSVSVIPSGSHRIGVGWGPMDPGRRWLRRAAVATVAALVGLVAVVQGAPRFLHRGASMAAHPEAAPPATTAGLPDTPATSPSALPATVLPPRVEFERQPPEGAPVALPRASRIVAPTTLPLRQATVDCDPPFTIDQRGHKHYKSACLK